MGAKLIMSAKERRRKVVFEQVKDDQGDADRESVPTSNLFPSPFGRAEGEGMKHPHASETRAPTVRPLSSVICLPAWRGGTQNKICPPSEHTSTHA